MPQSVTMALTKKNYNTAVNDKHIGVTTFIPEVNDYGIVMTDLKNTRLEGTVVTIKIMSPQCGIDLKKLHCRNHY